jgi:hypothetical protein
MLQMFLYFDHQFRNRAMTIKAFGEMGMRASMQEIPPIQMDRRFEFTWYGAEAARNEARMQLQMAGLNAIRSIPPQSYPGYQLNLAPVISKFIENLFGPRLSTEIFEDVRKKMSLDAEFENELLQATFKVPVQPLDDDQQHMQIHAKLLQEGGDPSGVIREHLFYHQMQMQKKQQAMLMQQQQQLTQAAQGPGGGQPRPGAKTAGPRAQGPAGSIPRDQQMNMPPRQNRGAM